MGLEGEGEERGEDVWRAGSLFVVVVNNDGGAFVDFVFGGVVAFVFDGGGVAVDFVFGGCCC